MSRYRITRTGLISVLLVTCFACSNSYNVNRVYIPKHSAEQQLEVEVSPTQSHLGYSVTEKLAVHLGAFYTVSKESEFDFYTNTRENMSQFGGELGVHYTHPLASMLNLSLGLSSTLEQWSAQYEIQWYNSNSDRRPIQSFQKSSRVIRPAAQLAATLFLNQNSQDESRSALTLFTRLHNPLFTSQEMSETIRDPLWLDVGAHFDLKLSQQFGFYLQVFLINPLRTDQITDQSIAGYESNQGDVFYWIAPLQGSFGLSYRWGAEVHTEKVPVEG